MNLYIIIRRVGFRIELVCSNKMKNNNKGMKKMMKKKNLKTNLFLSSLFFVALSFFLLSANADASSRKKVPKGYVGIYNAKDLKKMKKNLNQKYILMKNINLKGNEKNIWKSLGYTSGNGTTTPFTGVFNGNGHTISNAYFTNAGGLFAVNNGVIKNLTLKATAKPTGNLSLGALANTNLGTIKGCCIQLKMETGAKVLGFYGSVCSVNTGVITNCTAKGNILTHCSYGGIAYLNQKGHIAKCKNTSNIAASVTSAGIVAVNDRGSIVSCKNCGKLSVTDSPNDTTLANGGNYSIGGIAGNNWGYITNCTNSGALRSSLEYSCVNLGGIAGQNRIAFTFANSEKFDSAINRCKNTASITTNQAKNASLGGIIGYHDSSAGAFINNAFVVTHFNLAVTDCSNAGTITGTTPYGSSDYTVHTGGILGNGQCGDANQITLYQCSNSGSVTAEGTTNPQNEYNTIVAGGIAGSINITSQKESSYCYAIDCTNTATVKGFTGAYGILSSTYTAGSAQVKSCTNSGSVTSTLSTEDAYSIASRDTVFAVSDVPTTKSCKTKTIKMTRFKTQKLLSEYAVTSWVSSNRKLASVNAAGKVTALREGTIKITAYLKEGRSITWKIKINR